MLNSTVYVLFSYDVKSTLDLTFVFRKGLYLGWFPVVSALSCSNFIYFYTYNGLKSALLGGRSKASPLVDLSLAFVSGIVAFIRWPALNLFVYIFKRLITLMLVKCYNLVVSLLNLYVFFNYSFPGHLCFLLVTSAVQLLLLCSH